MAADDLLNILPIPALSDDELGVSPLGPAPVAPQMPQESGKDRAVSGVMLALAALMGPQRGAGIPQGVLMGQQQRANTRNQQFSQAQQQFQREDQQYAIAHRQHETQVDQRQRTYQTAIENLRRSVAATTDKAQYDAQIEAYAARLAAVGYRGIDANRLRQQVPFVAPSAEKRAQDTIAKWLKNPNNDKLLKDDPQRAASALIPFDRDDDGIDEQITLTDLATVAQQPFAMGPDGRAMFSEPGTTAELKANADGILQQLMEKAKAEGKPLTPDLMVKLQQEAIRLADQAKPEDPYLTEMRRMRTEEMRRRQNIPGELSPAQFNMANKLADDFARDSKDFIARAQSYETVQAAAKDPSAAGDLSLIFAFMKMLDPGSVVRENEFATAQNAAGVPDRVRNVWNRLKNGERLAPAQRADFIRQAANVYGASKARQDGIVSTYRQRAARAQVPAELVVMEYGVPEVTAQEPPADPAASAREKLKQR